MGCSFHCKNVHLLIESLIQDGALDKSSAAALKELKTHGGDGVCSVRGKNLLWSPLLLSLIKFSALITIKPLSMYNNVCITEQHRCSPSKQLNIKLAVTVLIAMLCARHLVCVCVCLWLYTSQAIAEGTPLVQCCRLETCSASLVPPVSPRCVWPIFTVPLSTGQESIWWVDRKIPTSVWMFLSCRIGAV